MYLPLFIYFQGCGVILLISGFYLFNDAPRVLLSRLLGAGSEKLNALPQPLFFYIALGLISAGLIAIFASIIGWWATCLNTYCILSFVSFYPYYIHIPKKYHILSY